LPEGTESKEREKKRWDVYMAWQRTVADLRGLSEVARQFGSIVQNPVLMQADEPLLVEYVERCASFVARIEDTVEQVRKLCAKSVVVVTSTEGVELSEGGEP